MGTAVRDYIHVEDLAAAHVLALEAHHGGADAAGYGCRARRLGKIGQVLKYSFMVATFIKRSGYGDGAVMFVLSG
ncbi:hypothetical protein E308F_28440 [Moorella sp. E308F]|nr:hypothetical protein E308F_28440 [Moorella sp. E308F]GEA17210.1 hypothetical protein E306M_03440 [Moorella sp. E306M]